MSYATRETSRLVGTLLSLTLSHLADAVAFGMLCSYRYFVLFLLVATLEILYCSPDLEIQSNFFFVLKDPLKWPISRRQSSFSITTYGYSVRFGTADHPNGVEYSVPTYIGERALQPRQVQANAPSNRNTSPLRQE